MAPRAVCAALLVVLHGQQRREQVAPVTTLRAPPLDHARREGVDARHRRAEALLDGGLFLRRDVAKLGARTQHVVHRPPEVVGLGTGLQVVTVGSGTVCLAESVATCNQGDSFVVIHGHAAESCADILGSSNRIWLAVRTLGVDVDQTHVGSAERLLEIAVVDVSVFLFRLIAINNAMRGNAWRCRIPNETEARSAAQYDGPYLKATPPRARGLETGRRGLYI